MKDLYLRETAEKKRKTIKYWVIITVAIVVAAIVACVIISINVNTANAAKLQLTATLVSIVAGWAVIFFWFAIIDYNRKLAMHYNLVVDLERERVVGELVLGKKKTKIGGVTSYAAIIRTGAPEPIEALVFEGHYDELKKLKGKHVFEMAYNFVAGYGEEAL